MSKIIHLSSNTNIKNDLHVTGECCLSEYETGHVLSSSVLFEFLCKTARVGLAPSCYEQKSTSSAGLNLCHIKEKVMKQLYDKNV